MRTMTDHAKTVLVVDDDPDAREYLSTVLQDNGFIATTANDGAEAIAAIEQQPPDLVALDITMPEKSGVAVYRMLKEDENLKSIPVIIVTGISEEFERFISTRRQVPPPEGYISKPVDAEEFTRMVRELIG
jgi:CheY-like chemotaxis protein